MLSPNFDSGSLSALQLFKMASSSNQAITLIEKLNKLSSRLSSKDDVQANNEALQLSKELTASLEEPKNAAVHLAFSVRHLLLCLDMLARWLTYFDSHSLP